MLSTCTDTLATMRTWNSKSATSSLRIGERLLALGSYEFNMGRFHTDELVLPTWAPASEVLARIPAEGGGDIYARLRP